MDTDNPPSVTIQKVFFTIPGRPVGKASPRVTTHGTFLPKPTREWMRLVSLIARRVAPPEPWVAPVEVSITAAFAIGERPYSSVRPSAMGAAFPTKKPDADNISKGVCDAINGIIFADDSQVVKLTVDKVLATEASTKVVVTCLTEQPCQIGLGIAMGKRTRKRKPL